MRHAFTLAETLVAAGVSLLLLGVVASVFSALRRTSEHGEQRQLTVRESLVVTSRLRADFKDSYPGKAHLTRQGQDWTLSFPSCQGTPESPGNVWNDKGQILWRKWVQYTYSSSVSSLWRREQSRTATAEVSEAAPTWIQDRSCHILARHLRQCQIEVQEQQLLFQGKVEEGRAHSPLIIELYPHLYGQDVL